MSAARETDSLARGEALLNLPSVPVAWRRVEPVLVPRDERAAATHREWVEACRTFDRLPYALEGRPPSCLTQGAFQVLERLRYLLECHSGVRVWTWTSGGRMGAERLVCEIVALKLRWQQPPVTAGNDGGAVVQLPRLLRVLSEKESGMPGEGLVAERFMSDLGDVPDCRGAVFLFSATAMQVLRPLSRQLLAGLRSLESCIWGEAHSLEELSRLWQPGEGCDGVVLDCEESVEGLVAIGLGTAVQEWEPEPAPRLIEGEWEWVYSGRSRVVRAEPIEELWAALLECYSRWRTGERR